MIGVIVLLAGMAIAYMIAYGRDGGVAVAPVVTKQCPPHKWVYDANDKLVCSLCPFRPGQSQGDDL